jgi:hypothetical protein
MSPADEGEDAAPESEPPPADPEVREALDRMEDERELPDSDDAADRDEDEDEQTEGEAPTG